MLSSCATDAARKVKEVVVMNCPVFADTALDNQSRVHFALCGCIFSERAATQYQSATVKEDPADSSKHVCIVCEKPSEDGLHRKFYLSETIGKYVGAVHEAVNELDVPEAGDVDETLAGMMQEPLDSIPPGGLGGHFGALPLDDDDEEDPAPPVPKPPRKNSNAYMRQTAIEHLGEDATEADIDRRVGKMKAKRKVEAEEKKRQVAKKMTKKLLPEMTKQLKIQKRRVAREMEAKTSAQKALEWLLAKINKDGCPPNSRARLQTEMWNACAESDTLQF